MYIRIASNGSASHGNSDGPSYSATAIRDMAWRDIEDELAFEAWDELIRDRDYIFALDDARHAKHEVLRELKARFVARQMDDEIFEAVD